MNAIRIVLVLATVGGGFAGILAAANGFWTTNVADNRLLELLWFSLVTYSIITIAGLIFVIRGRVGRFMMLALGSMVPWRFARDRISLNVCDVHSNHFRPAA